LRDLPRAATRSTRIREPPPLVQAPMHVDAADE